MIISRPHLLICLTFCTLPWLAVAGWADDRPNVLLILTDDQGYGDLSIHGNPHLSTPHIDSLANAGVRFERFYVNSFCAPTRAALLTGRYPLRCGVWGVTHNKECMRPEEVTLAEALKDAGYRTACIGKWHNGEQFPYTAPGQGFDEFFGFHNGHINQYFNTQLIRGSQPVSTEGYITDVLTDEALRFLRANRERPFFCYVSYNAPHSPYQVPDQYFTEFQQQGFDPAVSAFFGMCENIDDNVGRLLALLDELQLTRNTIVLFLTDNGGTAGVKVYNAGMRGGKTSVHEGGCRVPLFIRWPARWTEPKVVSQITSHIDLYPTLLELCDVEAAEEPAIDGMSLRPLLDDPQAEWPERVLFTHNPISQSNRYPGAVRTQKYRLVCKIRGPQGGSRAQDRDNQAGKWQLFDMQEDPGEERDLAQELPQVVRRLSRMYEEWLDDISRDGLERFPLPVGYAQENPVRLNAPQAYFDRSLRFFSGPGWAHDWLTGWTDRTAKIWFEIDVVQDGWYAVELQYACPASDAGARIRIRSGQAQLETSLPAADAPTIPLAHRDARGKQRYVNLQWGTLQLGRLPLSKGRQQLTIEALTLPGNAVMDFKSLKLEHHGDAT